MWKVGSFCSRSSWRDTFFLVGRVLRPLFWLTARLSWPNWFTIAFLVFLVAMAQGAQAQDWVRGTGTANSGWGGSNPMHQGWNGMGPWITMGAAIADAQALCATNSEFCTGSASLRGYGGVTQPASGNYTYEIQFTRPQGSPAGRLVIVMAGLIIDCPEPYSPTESIFGSVEGVPDCVIPFDCSSIDDQKHKLSYSLSGSPFSGMMHGSQCIIPPGETDGCTVSNVHTQCLGDACVSTFDMTDDSCFTVDAPQSQGQAANTNCISAGGQQTCWQNESTNCGTVNGEHVCLGTLAENSCKYLASGGMVCGTGAPAPPAPSTPDGMDAAEPDAELGAVVGEGEGETRDFNIFLPGTVEASGTATEGEGPDVGDGEGEGEGEIAGECEFFAQTLCDMYEWMTGEGDLGELPEVPTEEVEESEWSAGFGSGSCPADRVASYGGQSISYSFQTACDNAPIFKAVLLMISSVISGAIILGVRI